MEVCITISETHRIYNGARDKDGKCRMSCLGFDNIDDYIACIPSDFGASIKEATEYQPIAQGRFSRWTMTPYNYRKQFLGIVCTADRKDGNIKYTMPTL